MTKSLRFINATGCTVLVITHDPEAAAAARRDSALRWAATRAEPCRFGYGAGCRGCAGCSGHPCRSHCDAPLASHRGEARLPPSRSFTDDSIEAISALTSRPLRTPLLASSFALSGRDSSALWHERIRQVNQRLLGPEITTLYISDRDNDQNVLMEPTGRGESAQNAADRISADYVKNTGFAVTRGTRRRANHPIQPLTRRTNPNGDWPSLPPKTRFEQIGARMNP